MTSHLQNTEKLAPIYAGVLSEEKPRMLSSTEWEKKKL